MRYINGKFFWVLLLISQTVFAADNPVKSAYQFNFKSLYGDPIPLSQYKGKVVLVVNTTSKCGYTPQYKELQQLYQQYKDDGLVVIGVPSPDFGNQEFTQPKQVLSFTQDNYSVSFPLTAITHVKGKKAHPFYLWAVAQLGAQAEPKWNFHKLLINKQGNLVQAFPSADEPLSKPVLQSIQRELNQ